MAKLIARDVQIKVAGVDLSDHLSNIDESFTWDRVDLTGMGSTYREFQLGLADASITCDFWNDFAASSVYATLKPLAGQNSPFEVEVVPVKSLSIGATNPRIVLFCVLNKFSPVTGAIGAGMDMKGVVFYNTDPLGPRYYTT